MLSLSDLRLQDMQYDLQIRPVYWQESGDAIHIMIQGLQYDMLRYTAIP